MSLVDQVLPIFLLIALGVISRLFNWLDDAAVAGLRQIVVRLVLPSILFLSFVDMELSRSYLSIVGIVFAVCALSFAIGWPLVKRLYPADRFTPFLTAGYEFGMLGISLFVGAYGAGALASIAVIGLGHELFIWFVFFAFLIAARDGSARPADLLMGFLRNPVTAAILAGLLLNMLGVRSGQLEAIAGLGAVIKTLRFLAPMIVPAVLIVVGHGLRFDGADGGKVVRLIGLRLMIQLPLALAASFFVLGTLCGFDLRYQVALFTLMILPPPFIVPLFMPDKAELAGERALILKVLTVHTLASLAVFAGIIAAFPTF
ncbi:AEC family transporter [Oryzibacter oryziterrae]|uniref:AEC family transporter n=1 Tax=Oryzibacter oryziterrae TaxID=2766474 RepID=UPI001F30CA80|nr:AEC family transporter [Oryzibacter oryziterrae]